jgi:hypothetical protein
MAKKIDEEFIKDTRKEKTSFNKKNDILETENPESLFNDHTPPPAPDQNENLQNGTTAAENAERIEATQPPPVNSEFKEKFDEYFKGSASLIAGETVVNMVDDLKTNLLFIYAKKNGVDLPKEAFKMDEKAKTFAAFLVDHGLKNKMFTIVEKYPIASALGVIGISGVSTYLMIEMLKKDKKEAEKMQRENEQMRKKIAEMEAQNAVTITPPVADIQDQAEQH